MRGRERFGCFNRWKTTLVWTLFGKRKWLSRCKKCDSMKLHFEPSHFKHCGLSVVLTKKEWNAIRKEVLERAGGQCEICGTKTSLACHEVWKCYLGKQYQDQRVQKLVSLKALCKKCHATVHIDSLIPLESEPGLNMVSSKTMKELEEHYCRVNGVDKTEFDWCKRRALTRARRGFDWTLDYGKYNDKVYSEIPHLLPETALNHPPLHSVLVTTDKGIALWHLGTHRNPKYNPKLIRIGGDKNEGD